MRIEVTQQDIDEGERDNPDYCPLALAIGRAMEREVSVTHHAVWPLSYSPDIIARLPAEATDFALAFDGGREVGPMEFELEPHGETP